MAPSVFGSCSGPDSCGYNGKCLSTGECACTPPWRGPECQVLDLAPVALHTGYHLPTTSSWGGSVLQADDGRFYMWAAEMVGHCGIGAWTRNSRVILASADNLSAPFQFEQELFGVFSHEPAATRGSSGEYVVYYTTTTMGCGEYGPCVPSALCDGQKNTSRCNPGGPTCLNQCSNGSTVKACYDYSQDADPRIRFPTYMSYADHPRGPYSKPVMVYSGADQPSNSAPSTGDTNLAAVIFEDGSLTGMWRGDRKVAKHYGPVYQYQYRVSASNWKDPTTYVWGHALKPYNIFPQLVGPNDTTNCGIEDPTLWVDKAGIVHAVVHNWKAGGHAVSADRGKTWQWYGGNCSSATGPSSLDWTRSVWPPTINFTDQTSLYPHRRERPHLVIGNDGAVVALTTAVQLGAPGNDHTFTLVQETHSSS